MPDNSRLSYFRMTLFGFATLGASMFWSVNFAIVPLLLERITPSATLIGFALSLGAVSGVLMPIFSGLISDRIETAWGRRRPFILFGGIIASVAVVVVPLSRVYVIALLTLMILYVALNSYISPVFAFIPDFVPANQRGQAASIYGILRGIGTLAGFAIGGYLWRYGVFQPFLATGMIILLTALVTVVGAAGYDVAGRNEGVNGERVDWRNLGRYFKDVAGYPAAISFFCAQSLWWAGFGVAIPFFTLFAKNVLGMSVASSTSILAVFGIITIAAMFPVGKLSDRFDHRLLMGIGLLIVGIAGLFGYFVKNLAQVYVVMVFCALGISALTTLPFAFVAEIGPDGRKAEFYGLDNISISAPQIFALLLGGILIDYVGYRIIFLIASAAVFLSIIVLFFGERGLQRILSREPG